MDLFQQYWEWSYRDNDIDKTQYKDYTKNSGADVGGTTVGGECDSSMNRCVANSKSNTRILTGAALAD